MSSYPIRAAPAAQKSIKYFGTPSRRAVIADLETML
jgi:hypothetical protein